MALPIASVVAGALIDPTTFGNEVVNAINAAPRGRVAYASSTTTQSGISSVTDLTGLSVTFTAAAGRRYRVSVQVRATLSTTAGAIEVYITDGSNVVQNTASIGLAVGETAMFQPQAIVVPGAGSVTYKARAILASGGTLATVLSSTQPAFILVEDIGT